MSKTVTGVADDAVQEEILQVALGLYRKYGPEKVTMDDVANATGRSRTSLYYYYKNRDEIYQAVLDTIVLGVANNIRIAAAAAATLDEKIYAFCTAKVKTSEEWKTIFKAMWISMNADEKSKHSRSMNTLHKKLIHQESIIINEILADALNRNEIRNIGVGEQDMLAFIISTGIRGIRNEVYNQDDPHDMKAAVRLLAGMVIKWLKS